MLNNRVVIIVVGAVLSGCSRSDLADFENGNSSNIIRISSEKELVVGPRAVSDSYAPIEESPKSNNYEAPISMVEQYQPEKAEGEIDEPKVPVVKTVKKSNHENKADLKQAEIKPEKKTKSVSISSNTLVDGGRIVSRFGDIVDGYKSDGMVIKAPLGNNVHPIKNGTVIYAGNRLKEYGNIVVVKHDNDLISTYAHLQKILVNKDDTVTTSTNIGTVGKTGDAKFSQIYLQLMKNSITIDPAKYIILD